VNTNFQDDIDLGEISEEKIAVDGEEKWDDLGLDKFMKEAHSAGAAK
jgi:hypothetical protein